MSVVRLLIATDAVGIATLIEKHGRWLGEDPGGQLDG